ncbi:MAG: LysR family transcriptional regulator [Firmicutes bacterium]|nr:LysR family transcriptional regulator [Bacillota bacterium]
MRLIWLELVLETERCKSISLAAEHLNISQSAASRMIVNAENELSTKLFDRSSKMSGISMTAEGKRLLPFIEETVEAYRKLRKNASNDATSIIRLGMSEDTWGASARSRILSGFYLKNPDVIVKIDLFKNDRLINALLEDKVDIVVYSMGKMLDADRPEPFGNMSVDLRFLGDHPISVAYSKDFAPPGIKDGKVHLADLKNESFIIHMDIKKRQERGLHKFFFLEACRAAGFEPKTITVENASDIKQTMVMTGQGVFMSSAPEGLREYPGVDFALIEDCPYLARYFLISQKTNRSPYLNELHEFLKQFF